MFIKKEYVIIHLFFHAIRPGDIKVQNKLTPG